MPVYAPGDPPPSRSRAEVEAVLAGGIPAATIDGTAGRPLRVVLVSGAKDHGPGEHDYPAWRDTWSRLLAVDSNTVVASAFEFPDPEQASWADVLVFYQRGRWDTARAEIIDPFLARGGGLVYLHWAVDGQGGQQEMARRIGLSALGGGISYRHGALDIDFGAAGEHPVARNLERVRWIDESYWGLTGDPDRIDLIGTSLEDGAARPQFWSVEHGPGRVFVSIPGHFAWTFDDPLFRTLILRGIAWAGHRDVDRFNGLVDLDARID